MPESKIAVHTGYVIRLLSAVFYERDGTGRRFKIPLSFECRRQFYAPALVFLVDSLLRCRRCPLLRFVPSSAFLPTLFVQSVHFSHCSFPTRQLFQFCSVPPCFHLRPPFTTDHYSFVPRSTMRVKSWIGHARSITGNDLRR